MMKKTLEVCVDSLASARAAIEGGADRLELCSALSIGGLTPYTELLRQIRKESDIPIRCLMRPRAGDFLYTPEEIRMMVMQMQELRSWGANGFVIGCLTPEGLLDKKAMEQLIDAAKGRKLTLHRCIDVSRNLEETYLEAARMGFQTVLTSGGAGNCMEGKQTIGQLLKIQRETDGPDVLIGAGVSADAITQLRTEFPGANCFHMSGKTEVESGMRFRRKGVPMGIPGFDEWHIQQTSAEAVKNARQALDR